MTTQNQNTPAVQEKNISDSVLAKINLMKNAGQLKMPENYSPENALKSAYLVLTETKDKNGGLVLTSCTKESIANTLLDMVVQGLSPMKKQCYFIAYGNKLTLSRSYQGSIAVAKRVGLKSIVSNAIYEKDTFQYEVDSATGRKRILKHEQSLENIDLKNIKGAYAITELEDGTRDLEVMTMVQIRNAWNQGAAKGKSGAHENFTDEMACKTVINRACKDIINSSDDAYLNSDEEAESPLESEIHQNANKEEIGFAEAEVIETKTETPANEHPEPEKSSKKANQQEPGF
jgi:recombination protein RecT